MRSLRKLYLPDNNLSASIDSLQGLCELKNLRVLFLDSNNLDGRALPPCLSNLSKLERLSLSGNDLGSYSSALTGLCGMSALKFLDLSSNHFDDGSLPMCMGNFSLLEILYLSNNNLSGHFGNSISGLCGLSALTLINLSGNYLSSLPICMGNFSLLQNLDLSWNNLSSLFGNSIPGLKRVRFLYLDSNDLTGDGISPWIFNLTSLTWLYLGNNKLKSSDTIRGLCGLSALTIIDLSGNYLSSLPICMGNFSLLGSLDLSQNNLSSLFGYSIPGLKQLYELNLKSNQLTDEDISPWISNFTSLTELHLGNNKLKGSDTMRGAIPHEKQFLTFDESSYTGNHDLCGPPLHRNCSANNPCQTRDSKGEEEDDSGILDNPMFFYLVVAISYALGFWSFIALICNKNRRENLFRTADRCYDWVYVKFQWFQLSLKSHCN